MNSSYGNGGGTARVRARIRAWLRGPVPEPRRLDRRPGLVRALSLIVFACVIAYVGLHWFRYASIVTDENIYVDGARGVTITRVFEGGASDKAGLEVGDVIVEVNGNPVKNTVEAMRYIVEGTHGRVLDYTVLRGERRLVLHVALAEYGLPVAMLITLIGSLVLLASGAFVVLRRPEQAGARLFALAHLCAGLFLGLMHGYSAWYYPDILTTMRSVLSPLAWTMTVATMYHLTLRFPVPRFTLPVPRGLLVLVYGVSLSIPFIAVLFGKENGLVNMLLTFFAIGAFEAVTRSMMKGSRNPEYGLRARGMQAAGVLFILYFVVLLLLQDRSSAQILALVILPATMLPLLTVIRQRLFALYVVVRRRSMYSVSTVSLDVLTAIVCIAVLHVLVNSSWDLPIVHLSSGTVEIVRLSALPYDAQIVAEKAVLVLIGATAFAVIAIGRRRMRLRLDRIFHRGSYDYRLALREFSRLSTRYTDRRSLADEVVSDITTIMHLTGAAIAFRSHDRFDVYAVNGLTLPDALDRALDTGAAWIDTLREHGAPQAVDNLSLREEFGTAIEFVVPVLADGRIEALLLLGAKLAETNYTRDDVELLANLAINIADAIMIMDFYEGAKEQERMRRELDIARRIQLGSLPTDVPSFPGIDLAAASVPAHEVGGDFYDFLPRHDSVTVLVGDVSGKGTPAALHLARIQGVIRTIESYEPSPWELLVRLNTQIFDYLERQVYVTVAALRIEFDGRRCTFLRAGHLPMLQYRAVDGDVLRHRPGGMGAGLDVRRFGEQLEPLELTPDLGDVLVLATDGVIEAFDAAGNEFGEDRLASTLRTHAHLPASGIKDAILSAVARHAGGAAAHDDATLVVIRFQ